MLEKRERYRYIIVYRSRTIVNRAWLYRADIGYIYKSGEVAKKGISTEEGEALEKRQGLRCSAIRQHSKMVTVN